MSQRFPNASYPEPYPEANMGKADDAAVNATRQEIQSLNSDGTSGDFTLSLFGGTPTAAIAWNAAAADVKSALELLAEIGEVTVTGGILPAEVLIEFVDPGPSNIPLLVADDTGLSGETLGTVILQVQPGSLAVTEATGAPL
jgi:hypothetical protein